MTELELIDVEGELGVILPDEMLSRLGVTVGDDLVLAERAAGYLLTAAKPAAERKPLVVPWPS